MLEIPSALHEPLLKQCAEAGSVMIGNFLAKLGDKTFDVARTRHAMEKYAERYISRHGLIKVLGMSSPVPLFQIYTEVQTVSPDYLRSMQSVESMEKLFSESSSRGFGHHKSPDRIDGMLEANQVPFLNILGPPGAGKSTFLKRAGIEALLPRKNWVDTAKTAFVRATGMNEAQIRWSTFTHECIPVFVELRRFREENLNIFSAIAEEFTIAGFPNAESFTSRALNNGQLLLLLDGLDEVPANRLDETIHEIRNFVDRYGGTDLSSKVFEVRPVTQRQGPPTAQSRATGPLDVSMLNGSDSGIQSKKKANRFITSCRTAFYKGFFQRFSDVVLADFDDRQIKAFIERWFSSKGDPERSRELLNSLADESNSATLELARTPLLLTFICLVFDTAAKLPPNRSILYKRAIDILLEKWSAEKRVHLDLVYDDLHSELELQMLAEIAGESFAHSRLFFTKEDLNFYVSKFLTEEMQAPKRLNASRVIYAIETQQGLIVERADGVYSFSHLTVQEYLTALYFVESGRVNEVATVYIFDQKWREVVLLLAGMLPKSDDFLGWLSESVRSFLLKSKKVSELISFVAAIHDDDMPETRLKKRAATLLYLLWDDVISEIGSETDNLIKDCRKKLEEILEHSGEPNQDPFRNPEGKVPVGNYRSLHGIRRWSREDVHHFSEYLRTTLLILESRNASLRVSRESWQCVAATLLC